VEDHCSGIEAILLKGKVGETYLIGSMHEDIPNIEVTRRILKIMGKDENYIEYVKDRPGHDRRYAIDWSKIHNELGWSPKYEFNEALERTVQWYKNNESWWKRVKSGEYKAYYEKQYGKS
jgi:dTDP-glucose 4,6-dehydratase